HSRNAGNVIDAVAHQSKVVRQLMGMYAEAVNYCIRIGLLFFAVVPQKILLADQQLAQILVAAENGNWRCLIAQQPAETAQKVVGLVSGTGKARYSEQLGDLPASLQLEGQCLVCRRAAALVIRIDAVAKAAA